MLRSHVPKYLFGSSDPLLIDREGQGWFGGWCLPYQTGRYWLATGACVCLLKCDALDQNPILSASQFSPKVLIYFQHQELTTFVPFAGHLVDTASVVLLLNFAKTATHEIKDSRRECPTFALSLAPRAAPHRSLPQSLPQRRPRRIPRNDEAVSLQRSRNSALANMFCRGSQGC